MAITKNELAARVAAYREMLNRALGWLTDEQSLEVVTLFPAWEISKEYGVDDKVKFGDKLYKCLTAHTSQESWTPDVSPSLWVRVDDPAIEWPEWIQPVGATDAYGMGAKVAHNGSNWISDVDGNVWEPGVYGWSKAE